MNDQSPRDEKVAPLKKVVLSWEAGRSPDAMDTSGPQFDFVYGIGTQGLSPFEYALADKQVGDMVTLQIERDRIPEIFEHIEPHVLHLPEDFRSFYFRVIVEKVVPADSREIIKAMAETASCGDDCCGH
jgi:hypothetical protein